MKHWVTDLSLYTQGGVDSGCTTSAWYMFHLLRLLNWSIVAECDNTSITACSHIPDGCLDDPGVTNWAVVGTATRAKSDVQFYAGYRSLTFTTVATGDGVQSAVFTAMEASQAYVISVVAWNNCGHQLRVYVDNGNGSWASVGYIPDNAGVWTRYQFSYTSHTVVTACKFKVVDEAGVVSSGQVYLDSVYTARSWFDAKLRGSGTDGVIESSNNKFSSASYTFTDADITAQRNVCLVDLVNAGNSGIYRVIGRDGTKAILDIRDDGTTFLLAATGLAFRILDRTDIPPYNNGAGFCLESPHVTKWRWKYRVSGGTWSSGNWSAQGRWASSPEACQLNTDTFQFYKAQRSTSRNLAPDVTGTNDIGVFDCYGLFGPRGSVSPNRFYAVTDGETYVLGLHRATYPAAWFIGFLGDEYRKFEDTFVHMQEYYTASASADTLHFTSNARGWACGGCAFGARGLAAKSSIGSAGFGISTETTEYMTNAKANPWSTKESIRPFLVFVDWDGLLGEFATIESTNHDFGHCRSNLTVWNPFGATKEWFHAKSGLCIAWHGRGVQP